MERPVKDLCEYLEQSMDERFEEQADHEQEQPVFLSIINPFTEEMKPCMVCGTETTGSSLGRPVCSVDCLGG